MSMDAPVSGGLVLEAKAARWDLAEWKDESRKVEWKV